MKWIAISGSWRERSSELDKDLVAAVNEIIKNGDGIVTGGALGVDRSATVQMMQEPDWRERLKVIIPTPLDVWKKHYRRRADEGVTSRGQAEDLIELLNKIKQGGCLVEMDFDVLNQETYYARNTEVVKNADELWAFQINNSGGVQDTVDKAKELGLKIRLKKYNSPIRLGGKVVIALSTVADGDMRNAGKVGEVLKQVNKNRETFLMENGFDIDRTVLVRLDYDKDDFTRYKTVDKSWAGKGMLDSETVEVADALATTEKNLGLFLPLADCLGAVIYDAKNEVLMISHLGRHNTEQFGAKKSIEYLQENFKSDPADILIWLSPAAGKENYPLFAFDNRSLREVNVEQFIEAGVKPENITGDDADTTTDDRYHSYSNDRTDRRFTIVAKMV